MTDPEIIIAQQKKIEKLERKIKRLEKRLVEKAHYEEALLIGTGATPAYISKISRKDRRSNVGFHLMDRGSGCALK